LKFHYIILLGHYPAHNIDTAEAEESSAWEADSKKFTRKNTMIYIIDTKDPSKASFKSDGTYTVKVGDRDILGKSIIQIASDTKNFNVTVNRKLYENGKLIAQRDWKETIPRDFQ
jgi:hypothetical protein